MITKSQIEQVINRAESEFVDCWTFLAGMKDGKLQQNSRISIHQFQPKLAASLFDLSRSYREIEQEKNRRITKKALYSASWFAARMQFLASQQQILNKAIAIGWGIGDAFVWFFYQHDRHYLAEHLAQPVQRHAPPGIGGAGELEFIKRVSIVSGYFVLYHGNTNILRLGDLTLFDLKNFRVAGIGELKSRLAKPGQLEISLLFSGPQSRFETPPVSPPDSMTAAKRKSLADRLSPSARDRLKRQIRRISNSYKKLESIPDRKMDVGIDGQIDEFAEFMISLKAGQFMYRQLGKSLLLVGYKSAKMPLFKKLSSTGRTDIKAKLAGVETRALGLLDKDRKDNAIIIGSFYYDSHGQTRHTLGMSHLVWWPLNQEIIKSILFQDVMISTVFNPAHFFAALEKIGFVIEELGALSYKVFRKQGNMQLELSGLSHYFAMIQHYLFPEEAITSLLANAVGEIANSTADPPQRIELLIEQKFGRPPV